jgi:hypothetical protein
MDSTSCTHKGVSVGSGLGDSPTRSTRYSPAICTHCGRTIVGLPRESQQFGFVPAECQPCHKAQLVRQLQQQIADKQRKGTR